MVRQDIYMNPKQCVELHELCDGLVVDLVPCNPVSL